MYISLCLFFCSSMYFSMHLRSICSCWTLCNFYANDAISIAPKFKPVTSSVLQLRRSRPFILITSDAVNQFTPREAREASLRHSLVVITDAIYLVRSPRVQYPAGNRGIRVASHRSDLGRGPAPCSGYTPAFGYCARAVTGSIRCFQMSIDGQFAHRMGPRKEYHSCDELTQRGTCQFAACGPP